MSLVSGNALLAASLERAKVKLLFYLMGGPMIDVIGECERRGIKCIDVRDERAGTMMAHAYSRVTGEPGVCITSAGGATTNAVTGISGAFVDCAPVIVIGGSTALAMREKGVFEEIDLLSIMKPITKRAWQIQRTERIPDFVSTAFRTAMSNRPGPIYLDCPGDILYGQIDDNNVQIPTDNGAVARPAGDSDAVRKAVKLLGQAKRPLILVGSGVLWAKAGDDLRDLVDTSGIPFFTTPLARGVVPEDHPLSFLAARSLAWKEADVILVVGTRANVIVQHLLPDRFAESAKIIAVNIDAEELGHNRSVEIGIVGDAKTVLGQLAAEARRQRLNLKQTPWVEKLRKANAQNQQKLEPILNSDQVPIHPFRLCKEVRDFLPRDGILVVDGQEILNAARQTIGSYCCGHRLNPGPFGCIGVGVPFGVGAKAAKPEKPVVVLTGDGSFGFGAIELHTAVRHSLPLVVVISNNGGWAGRRTKFPFKADLGHTSYEKLAESLGGYGERVEKPGEIGPALHRAFSSGKPAIVNVITDPNFEATTQYFSKGLYGLADRPSYKL